jgi:hypothetical protein
MVQTELVLVEVEEDGGATPVSCVAGHFPWLPPTPKPEGAGATVPDRTPRGPRMAGNVLPMGHVRQKQVECGECGYWQGGHRAWCDQCGGDLP